MTNGKSMYQDWRESRRIRAWELKQMGWKQSDIAVALGVTKGAVSQWLKRAEHGGKEALRSRPTPGRPARLSAEQKAKLPELLKRLPSDYGFQGESWTAERVAALIEQTFGVRYHPDHVGRLLRDSGLSPSRAARAARRRASAKREESAEPKWTGRAPASTARKNPRRDGKLRPVAVR
jgi:transposase